MRRFSMFAVLATTLLVPAAAHGAAVTAQDVAVRPGEASPWSKGTLFKGEGFQVGATTGNGWAYGRAKGSAERCGWVPISTLSSTTRTDDTCGNPQTEPLEDSDHVAGGGASERWYVTCQTATLFGNYGGAAGNLRSESGTVTAGTPVGWRYTTGNGYAASIDGPSGTPRFILRSCISRTAPAGAPGAGSGGLVGPDPYNLLDEDEIFELYGSATISAHSARRRSKAVRVKRTRASIRIAPNNIIVANGLRDDRFTNAKASCKGWVYGTINRAGTKLTGWVQASGLTRVPKARRACGRVAPYKTRIGFVNAPSRAVTYREKSKTWTTIGSASTVFLGDCQVSMNYIPGVGFRDPVTGPTQQLVFKNGDLSSLKGTVGYRYTTPDGQAALITAESGYVHTEKNKTRKVGMWGFVPRGCVQTTSSRGGTATTVYQSEIRICDQGTLPSKAVKVLNKGGAAQRDKRIGRKGPCRFPNKATKAGKPAPDSDQNGWRFTLKR